MTQPCAALQSLLSDLLQKRFINMKRNSQQTNEKRATDMRRAKMQTPIPSCSSMLTCPSAQLPTLTTLPQKPSEAVYSSPSKPVMIQSTSLGLLWLE
ncbi:hypothetical protein TREES_T100018015 [Tupaia chinensis]|uniref:Uncharacterized protein n=1 Tax=Tupaia chinensis TaxID=246437 RepID=L9JDC2_TUPCH|nr:hypothetical protein TREES_T100018015 [Tupaia chinensis]